MISDDDPVGEHLRAAGDRRAVAAGLADHRRGLAGDGRLVDRGDALDDLAVGGDEVARLADDEVALARARRRRRGSSVPSAFSRRASVSERILRSVSACALPRPSAIASAKLAKRTVRNSQTVMRPGEDARVGDRLDEGDDRADEHDEHDRVLDLDPRVELRNESTSAWTRISRSKRLRACATPWAIVWGGAPARTGRARCEPSAGSSAIGSCRFGLHQKNFPWLSCSTIGPSETAGKKVKPADDEDHADDEPDEHRCCRCGRSRARRARRSWPRATPPSARAGIMMPNRPISMSMAPTML